MAKSYELETKGHPSIYEPKERNLKIYFSEPEQGANKDTGILLLIAGFGGHANSNVYKKMRNVFSDEYNLLVIQCDYFGWQYMQEIEKVENFTCDFHQFLDYSNKDREVALSNKENFAILLEIAKRNQKDLILTADLEENWSDFNDMGLMQAIDNITAVMMAIEYIKEKAGQWNENKVIIFGHSHGAYLGHLCNLFAPGLFTLLIDNSAWISPFFLEYGRMKCLQNGIAIVFDYLVRQRDFDREMYNLVTLYKKYSNTCEIVAFHGANDSLVDAAEKKEMIDSISNARFYLIDEKNIDHQIFRSTEHGLNADFIKMFRTVMNKHIFSKIKRVKLNNVYFHTSSANYFINYEAGVPKLKCEFLQQQKN